MAPEGYLFGRLFCVALTKGTESGRLKYFWTDLIDDSTDGDFLGSAEKRWGLRIKFS